MIIKRDSYTNRERDSEGEREGEKEKELEKGIKGVEKLKKRKE